MEAAVEKFLLREALVEIKGDRRYKTSTLALERFILTNSRAFESQVIGVMWIQSRIFAREIATTLDHLCFVSSTLYRT